MPYKTDDNWDSWMWTKYLLQNLHYTNSQNEIRKCSLCFSLSNFWCIHLGKKAHFLAYTISHWKIGTSELCLFQISLKRKKQKKKQTRKTRENIENVAFKMCLFRIFQPNIYAFRLVYRVSHKHTFYFSSPYIEWSDKRTTKRNKNSWKAVCAETKILVYWFYIWKP